MRDYWHRLLIVLLASGSFGSAWGAAAEDRQAAVWESHELSFRYVGFTSRYSCDGLRDKVQQALIALGAGRDLSVTPTGCTTTGGPEPVPSLQIKVSTPKPDAAGTVEARWKTVKLTGPGKLEPGDCELTEQIKREILPLFTTRNLKAQTSCAPPHQDPGLDVALSVDVLVPAKE
jgi:hypothetical protein